MPTIKKKFGDFGERVARAFLERKAYTFIAQNIHSRYGEIDLLMLHHGMPVCVEVKLRTSTWFGRPEESVTYQKRKKILHTWYTIREQYAFRKSCRIEVVSLLLDRPKRTVQVWHFTNIET